jgi:hypothetical protein
MVAATFEERIVRIVTSGEKQVIWSHGYPSLDILRMIPVLVQMKTPEGVAQYLVLHALGFAGIAFDGHAGTR